MMASKLLSAMISQDWRGIVLTALLASSILYFFVHQQNGRSHNDNKIVSDDERRQRREYLANIAEKRAKRMAAAAAAANTTTTTSSGSDSHGKKIKKSAPVNITNTRKNSQTPNKKNNADSAAAPKIDSCKEAGLDDENEVHKNEVTGPPNNCARGSLTEQRENLKEKSNEMKQHSSEQHNARENIENNTDERPTTVAFIGENKDEAITKVSTQEQKQQQQQQEEEESNSTLTLYLIKSTSPRIQITIPKNASASKLRQIVSNATNIPSSGLRLIFRGRMIVEEKKGGANVNDVVTEFGIEDGCALHVIGKSNNNEPGDASSSNESLPPPTEQQQTQQESLSSETATAEQKLIREIQQDLQMNPNYFHHLAAVGNYELLQLVIHNGSFSAEINRADENDWTPLHEAIRGGHQEVVTLLLDEGGLNMHAITNQGHGYSPISLSVHYHGENHPLTRMLRDREEETRVGGGDA